ncbi:Uncharacterized protein BM_BM5582 [Brugia malayi]|uniref:DUF7027 domain-containing protein n=1 Tax=Brugia malayi TaxID=6279 RepID=A0A4E9FHB3_BRUMA|nr:Uncharacterized protein BM_BM5582 [Brugia malayi]VIO95882.1 Uncharacterized protein BM_BM5582 [Brugia malayi]
MFGVTSALLIFGINKYKVKLMYPTLVARAIIVFFMQAFGVSIIVRPSHAIDVINLNESNDEIMHKNFVQEKMRIKMNELSAAQRLSLLIFFMILISTFVFYTLYLIVRCIRYVKAYKRLLNRKRSFIAACHINILDKRQSSLHSKNFEA